MKVENHHNLAKPPSGATYFPVYTTLPDGRDVIIDVMKDHHITDMYNLIESDAKNGHGFGVDEFPTEKDFRKEIEYSHNFIIIGKDCGKLIAAFLLVESKFYRGKDMKCVDPFLVLSKSERGKGIGDFIFRQAIVIAKWLGFSGAYVDTFTNNIAMIKIIERTPGFQRVGHFPMGGRMPDGSLVGGYLYFKDLKNVGEENVF